MHVKPPFVISFVRVGYNGHPDLKPTIRNSQDDPGVVDPRAQHLLPPVDGEAGPEHGVLDGLEVLVDGLGRLEVPVRLAPGESEEADVDPPD